MIDLGMCDFKDLNTGKITFKSGFMNYCVDEVYK